jgi:hypothetical protein
VFINDVWQNLCLFFVVNIIQVPALAETPFENLKILSYEGEHLPRHVAKFILGYSVRLEQLQLSLDTMSLEIIGKHVFYPLN